MKPKSKRSGDDGVPDFAAADVVLTTYEVLQKEVWHAKDDSARERRYERRYERKTSPLVASRWWRVCLDEAQRVESGVSKAAEMVGLIPRVHAWVVTGTPIGKAGIQDLEGLFLFLKQPRTLSDHLAFRRAMLPLPSYRNNLLAALGIIMHRNSKEHVKEDLTIPAQEEHIFPVNLKEVEREYYLQRLELCLEDMKSVLSAADVDSIGEVDRTKLGKWLTTLRQTCVHPQIGAENKRALGSQLIKSINDVLVWMVRQCSSDLTTAERQLVGVQIRRAQALEQRKAFADALKLYQNLLIGVEKSVAEARKELAALREEADARSAAGEGAKAGDADSMVTEEEDEATKEADDKLSAAAGRLAAWLEVEHRLVYFIACVHNTLKEQALEDQFYDRAESIRQEILGPRIKEVEKAKKRIDEAAAEAGSAGKNDLHIAPSTFKGGIVTQELMMQVDATVSALNKQSATMMAWRKKVLDVLTTDLDYAEPEAPQRSDPAAPQTAAGDPQLANGAGSARSSTEQAGGESASDEASGSGAKKPHGNEYQTSLKLQEDANVYQDAYNEALLDRITLLSGAPRPQEGTIHLQNSSDLLKQLYKERTLPKGLNNLKGLAASLRAHVANKPNMPETEAMLCQNELRRLNKEVDRNMKLIEALQKESRLMTKLQNARIEYFRALQDLSDSVEPGKFTEGDIADSFTWAIKQCAEDEKKLKSKIVQLDGRKKYLLHLSEETPEGEARVCVICRDEYNNAAITPCAHFFCLPCLTQWVNQHRKCPTCNSTMAVSEINRVSFNSTKRKSDELTLEGVIRRASSFCDVLPATSTTKVQKIHLLGSFGSKLDTIVRHIMSLDKGEKVVLFSQWEQVLDFLANGLAKNGIHYVRFQGSQRNRAAVQFRRNPEIRVFILHAKSQSSGLTLVNATHVMIVEPILHPGVELQAINRVHRIGQTRTTHVWRYLVANTIEEGLFELYETRRMALSGKAAAAQDADAEEDLGADVENARMLPLASRGGGKGGGGEVVGLGDIVSLLKGAFSALERDEEVALADKEH
ncbi:hypothetical protein DFJ74DRAFT_696102 [Hyaloraphidium curvatum]|nr:hypothetical protein DFJ74DRAFT_696102 [Hyaloraphidium curvatum]